LSATFSTGFVKGSAGFEPDGSSPIYFVPHVALPGGGDINGEALFARDGDVGEKIEKALGISKEINLNFSPEHPSEFMPE